MGEARIAVVEDEDSIAEVLQYNLEKAGYDVELYGRGDEALEGIRERPPDLVLLDLMLPGMDGLELTRNLKRQEATAAVPILMLTAKTEEVDRIVGLELGADDYLGKPFAVREVVLRVKAILRRATQPGPAAEVEWLEVGNLRLDPAGHQARCDGRELNLTATEFRLLHTLMERKGRTQSRSQLLTDVWGYAEDVDSRTVDTHVRRLRKKLGDEAHRLETVVGVGYRLRR